MISIQDKPWRVTDRNSLLMSMRAETADGVQPMRDVSLHWSRLFRRPA